MSTYAWTITRDFLDDGSDDESAVGVIGPYDATEGQMKRLEKNEGCYRFRMYDDDGELYYEGRITFDECCEAREVKHRKIDGYKDLVCYAGLPDEAFGPLDDFGRPNAGAVVIKYFDKDGRLGVL